MIKHISIGSGNNIYQSNELTSAHIYRRTHTYIMFCFHRLDLAISVRFDDKDDHYSNPESYLLDVMRQVRTKDFVDYRTGNRKVIKSMYKQRFSCIYEEEMEEENAKNKLVKGRVVENNKP